MVYEGISIEDFDWQSFAIGTAKYYVPFIVSLFIFLYLMHIIRWRPSSFLKYYISNLIHKNNDSIWVILLEIIYWIFCSLPFFLGITWGVVTFKNVSPRVLGIDIMFTVPACIFLLVGFKNFFKNGYKLNLWNLGFICSSVFLIFLLVFIDLFMMDEKSWMGGWFLAVFPGLLSSIIISYFNRPRIPKTRIKELMESESKRNEFIRAVSTEEIENWLKGGNYISLKRKILQIVIPLIVSGISSFFYFYTKDLGEEKIASITTAFLSFIVDATAIISMATTMTGYNIFIFVFFVLVLKDIMITFSSRFWLIGHGFLVLVIGTVNLQNAIYNNLYVMFPNCYRGIDNETNLDENVQNVIKGLNAYGAKTSEIVVNFLIYIFYFVLGLLEIIFTKGFPFEPIFDKSGVDIQQRDILIVVVTLSATLSVTIANTRFNRSLTSANEISILWIPVFLSIVVFWVINFFACDLWNHGINFYISTAFTVLAVVLHMRAYYILHWTYVFDMILLLGCMGIDYIALPVMIHSSKSYLYSMICASLAMAASYYFTFIEKHKKLRIMDSVFFVINCIAFITFSLLRFKMVGIALIFFIVWALVIIWRVVQSMERKEFNKFDLWTIFILTVLIAIPTGIFLFREGTGYKMIGCILFFIYVLVLMFTSHYALVQRREYAEDENKAKTLTRMIVASYIFGCIIEFSLFCLFLAFNERKFFLGLTTSCAIAFVCGALYILSSLAKNKPGYAIVFSDFFFPVRELKNGQLKTKKLINFTFPFVFMILWLWGVFASVFFIFPWFGILAQTSSLFLAILMMCYLIDKFDNTAIQFLDIIPEKGLQHVLNQAMKSVNASELDVETKKGNKIKDIDNMTYKEYEDYIFVETEKQGTESVFISSFRAQLKITGNIEFENALKKIKEYMSTVKAEWRFIDLKRKYTYKQREEILKVYYAIKNIDIKEKKMENYNKFIKEQERKRKVACNTILQGIKEEEYKEICQKLSETNEKYEDPDFYPSKPISEDDKVLMKGIEWDRGEEVFGDDLGIRIGGEDVDIKQGIIGDCYLLAAMADIAKYPGKVSEIFEDTKFINNGTTCVNFLIHGKRVPVIIDTRMPYRKEGFIFARPKDMSAEVKTWWPMLVEKAYAKLNGSITSIEGGECHDSLSLFVKGIPGKISMRTPEGQELVRNGELRKKMVELSNRKAFLCAGSNETSNPDQTEDGIVGTHAYSILEVVHIQGFTLVKMRNPWGEKEWDGDWSDNSKMWEKHKNIKKKLCVESKDDGIFWISFEDFSQKFNTFYYLDYQDEMNYYVISGVFRPNDENNSEQIFEPNKVPNYRIIFKGREAELHFALNFDDDEENTRMVIYLTGNRKPSKRYILSYAYNGKIISSTPEEHYLRLALSRVGDQSKETRYWVSVISFCDFEIEDMGNANNIEHKIVNVMNNE